MRMTLNESEQRYNVGDKITFELKAESSISGTYEVVDICSKTVRSTRWVYSLRKVKP